MSPIPHRRQSYITQHVYVIMHAFLIMRNKYFKQLNCLKLIMII